MSKTCHPEGTGPQLVFIFQLVILISKDRRASALFLLYFYWELVQRVLVQKQSVF
jgi:hypothetical protein